MPAKSLKSLNDVAITYSKLAQLYMVSGPWKPAYKTGNLYKQVGSYNTPQNMITTRPSRSATKYKIPQGGVIRVGLQFAPPGAEYGKWVEWGNGTGVGAGNPRPFAEKAAEDPLLKKTIDAYVKQYVEMDFMPAIKIGLDRAFRSLAENRANR